MGIFQYCVSDIAGMYSMTTTYGYHDFLPTYETNTQDMEIVDLVEVHTQLQTSQADFILMDHIQEHIAHLRPMLRLLKTVV
jgi:hypothetical protein